MRVYRGFYEMAFLLLRRQHSHPANMKQPVVRVETNYPVAYASPDHLMPWGTANDNSTNKKFVLHMAKLLGGHHQSNAPAFLDLGCSGGQLVKDFITLNWTAVGLEGSDYSLKQGRANWPSLAGRNLFTCDITKPFQILLDGQPARFDLITAWEVLEHIQPNDLDTLFSNICLCLKPGGYFVASTSSTSDIRGGIELHQCRLSNLEWQSLIKDRYPDLEPAQTGLKPYQNVRFNHREPSLLTYRKKS